MNFSWFFSKKIAWGKTSGRNLSRMIVRIGQMAVALGIIVALITLSTGLGAKKEIKQKLADFNGHITVKPYNSNLSYNSDSVILPKKYYPNFPVETIEHIQAFAIKNGIIRTENSFDGVLLKGVDEHFDRDRFQKFIQKGKIPTYNKDSLSNKVIVSRKVADKFYLDIDSSFVMIFVNEKTIQSQPIYRKFNVSAIYNTDIKEFDDLFIIGDIHQIQRINRWNRNTVGGFELFVDDIEQDLVPINEQVNNNIGYNLIAEPVTKTYAAIEDWTEIFDTNITLILVIMLVVVIINMIMVLLILILERTPSIGLLKTLGANEFQIQQTFIYYALFIMLPGLIIGNIIGIGLLLIQKHYGIIQLPPENYFISTAPVYLSWKMILLVNVGSLIISAIVLLIPSKLTSRITPSKAMRMK